MRWTFGRKRAAAMVVVAASVATWVAVGGGGGAHAYARWSTVSCNVPTNQILFLEDAPGAGGKEESVFLSVPNVANIDESCAWATPAGPLSTYFAVRFRAAVNDGGQLRIGVYDVNNLLIHMTASPIANSTFQVVQEELPPGHSIGAIRISLTDYSGPLLPDKAVTSGRTTALVDKVEILYQDLTVAWQDTYSAAG